MLSDEELRNAVISARVQWKLTKQTRSLSELDDWRAVAQLAATHERERLAGMAGVDAGEIARSLCRPFAYCTDGSTIEHQHAIVCESAVRDALREALAASEARHEQRCQNHRAGAQPSARGMVVDAEWLRRRIAADPDGECEAGIRPAPETGEVGARDVPVADAIAQRLEALAREVRLMDAAGAAMLDERDALAAKLDVVRRELSAVEQQHDASRIAGDEARAALDTAQRQLGELGRLGDALADAAARCSCHARSCARCQAVLAWRAAREEARAKLMRYGSVTEVKP